MGDGSSLSELSDEEELEEEELSFLGPGSGLAELEASASPFARRLGGVTGRC